jgi:AAA domain, putative AbiEii toxin, Type IV TA system
VITEISFHRFKQFKDARVSIHPTGISLLAGGNNSGKSSILHGLAVWEFCRTAIEMERKPKLNPFLAATPAGQGLGLGDDQFSPILLPSLKHLWTNLKTQRESEPDGYTLRIACSWKVGGSDRKLEFGLSLVNDRLFIKRTDSNLEEGDKIPRVAYLPPFAGITAREPRVQGAIRRRRIGEGLAGAVLRNLLLEMYERNQEKRIELRAGKSKISDNDLQKLRDTDPWEILQESLRTVFHAELIVSPFLEEYHSYIEVNIVKGISEGKYKLQRRANYSKRDIMVEGAGLLQWLSVFTLATSPEIDVLLFDEPDTHLHISLQTQLLEALAELAAPTQKQILLATHSSEILRHSSPDAIFKVLGSKGGKYLTKEYQKVGLLAGLGTDYAPRIDQIKASKRVLFLEGKTTDPGVLRAVAKTLSVPWPQKLVEWITPMPHKERKMLFRALKDEILELRGLSLRDRDDASLNTVEADLTDKSIEPAPGLELLTWRRRNIESYLLWPPAIAAVAGLTEGAVVTRLSDDYALSVGQRFLDSGAPNALMVVDGKAILQDFGVDAVQVAAAIPAGGVCQDLKTLLQRLVEVEKPDS